ncbi:MAG: hypothetical protein U9N44_02365 [Chloroflexota bacterium]|nr:hypothetical protein [Chloroflexota bacterium]
MSSDYQRVKEELEQLLELIRDGQATLEDARRQLLAARNSDLQLSPEAFGQEIERIFESRKKELIELAEEQLDDTAVIQLANEKAKGFPWLAKAYDDYFKLQDMRLSDALEIKSHPARKAAEDVRQTAKERREAEKAARIADNLIKYCRFLAPWLDEYIGMEAEELDTIIHEIHAAWEKKEKELGEEVKRRIGPSNYDALTPTEKLQRKLDWYWEKPNKTNWQIGKDYEDYIGYLYECKGWDVYFHGRKGFEDLGRDLICKRDKCVEIIQCKYWSQEKTIHEKHIYYLFGTTVEYYIENFGRQEDLQLSLFPGHIKERELTPKLVTTTDVSPKAEQVAEILGVVIEKIPFGRYPSVKCNVSRKTGEKIYHLPFDQQYETILIEEDKLECYVETVAEAEALGFRHAYRWKGEGSSLEGSLYE